LAAAATSTVTALPISPSRPSGAEQIAEIYYRYRIAPQFEVTPDFQWVNRGGANGDASSVKVFALRANIAY
jgi:high affinity Mn2+ porin